MAPQKPKVVQSRADKLKGAGQQTRKPATKRPRDTLDDFGDLDDYSEPPTRPCIASNVAKVAGHPVLSLSQHVYHPKPLQRLCSMAPCATN